MKAQAGKALPSQEGAPEGDNFDASFLTVRQPPTSVKDTPCSNFRGLDGCGGPRPLPDSPSKLKSPPTLDHSGGHPFLSSPFSGPKMSVHMKHLDPDSGTQPGHAVSLFAMGSAFPFSALPSPPPVLPLSLPPRHTVEDLSLQQTAPVQNAKPFSNPWKSASSTRSGVKGRSWQTEHVVFAVRSVEDLVVGWHTNKSVKLLKVRK